MNSERREQYRRALEFAGDMVATNIIEDWLHSRGKTGLSLPPLTFIIDQGAALARISRELRALDETP